MTHEILMANRCESPLPGNTPNAGRSADTAWHRRVLRGLPNVLVLVVISGVAYLGHLTDWRFGWTNRGSAANLGKPVVQIVVENEPVANLTETAHWCPDHGVTQCPLCFPQVAQLDSVPAVDREQLTRIKAALSQPGRSTNSNTCSLVHHCLRFESANAAEQLGVEVAPVWTAEMSETIAASAETSFDPTRVAHLSSRMAGSAWRVVKRLGQSVQKGEIVALIECGEVGRAKTELQQSLVKLKLRQQAQANADQAPVAEQQRNEAVAALRDAEARVLSAEQTLVNIGLRVSAAELANLPFEAIARNLQQLGLPSQFANLDDEAIPGTLLPIVSPLNGIVTQSDLIAGDVVEPLRRLFTIADASRLVLTLHVSPSDAAHIKVGQSVLFRSDGALRESTTRVNWIATAAKDRTRTVPVRAELNNDDGRLLASSFGLGRIVLRQEPNAVVVPNEAVQSDGDCELVFVRDKDFLKPAGAKVFHVRTVRTGARDAQNTEVIVGVVPGEVVATKGSGLLLNELRRHQNSQIVAGSQVMKQRTQTSRQPGVDHGHPTH